MIAIKESDFGFVLYVWRVCNMFARDFFFPGLQKTPNFFTSYSIQDSSQGTTIIREPGFCIKGDLVQVRFF